MASAMEAMTATTIFSPSTVSRRQPLSAAHAVNKSLGLQTKAKITRKVKPSGPQLFVEGSSSVATEHAVVGLTTAALVAAMVIPDIAEAAQPGLSPSLKNFLLSIISGGVVFGAIGGAVVGVSNFDPVKRN